jgi:hypothetical protein
MSVAYGAENSVLINNEITCNKTFQIMTNAAMVLYFLNSNQNLEITSTVCMHAN